MRNLGLLLRKELRFQWRTRRLLTLVLLGVGAVCLALAIEFGARFLLRMIAQSMPEELDLGPVIALLDRTPTLVGFARNVWSNFLLLPLGVVLVGAGCLADERSSGELAIVLMRPFSRLHLVLAKWLGIVISAWMGLAVFGLLFLLLAGLTLQWPRVMPLVAALLLLASLVSVYAAMTMLASSLVDATHFAIGLTLLLILGTQLLGGLPWLLPVLPQSSYTLAQAVAFGNDTALRLPWVLTNNLLWCALCLLGARWSLIVREAR